uniref:DUF7694 domain-containing protein n=1 Tax=Promicromonospora sp. CA-291202 TaxID=3240016 RepID=UPI003F49152D
MDSPVIPAAPGTSLDDASGMLWTQVPTFLGKAYAADVPDGTLHAVVTHEPQGWHVSVSFSGAMLRLPTWDELKDARYRFVPDRAHMAALLPPRAEWVDIHPTCLHLWEIPPETAQGER